MTCYQLKGGGRERCRFLFESAIKTIQIMTRAMFDGWPPQLPHNWRHMCTFLNGMKKYSTSERVFTLCRLLKHRDLPTLDTQQVQTSRKKFTKFVTARDWWLASSASKNENNVHTLGKLCRYYKGINTSSLTDWCVYICLLWRVMCTRSRRLSYLF